MKTYIYPENLSAKPQKWLWSLPALIVIGLMLAASVILVVAAGSWFFLAPTAAVTLLTARIDGITIGDFLRNCWRYFFRQQEYFSEIVEDNCPNLGQ